MQAPLPLRGERGLLAALLGATALCTLERFGHAAVWDDPQLLALAQRLRTTGGWLGEVFTQSLGELLGHGVATAAPRDPSALALYRPLSIASFALTQRASSSLLLHHVASLGLHLACTTLVYLLGRAVVPARAALLGAAWFALTPHLAEAHVWLSGRFDLLCTFFTLVSLLAFVRAGASEPGRMRCGLEVGCGLSFFAAALSKEAVLFCVPALALWPGLRGARLPARARALAPLLAATAAYAGLRALALDGLNAAPPLGELAVALARVPLLVFDSSSALLLPTGVYSRLLHEDYRDLGAAALGAAALGLAVLAVLGYRARATAPFCAWSVTWACATLVPIAVVSTQSWPGFGRFLYLPGTLLLLGVAELVVATVDRAPHLLWLARGACAAHLLALALQLHLYTKDFATDDALFTSIVAAAPHRSHGYAYLGMTYIDRGQYARAAALLRKALQIAPHDRRYMQSLAQALLFGGQRDAALALARDAIAHLDHAPEFHLVAAYAQLEASPDRAAASVAACLRDSPRHLECRGAVSFLTTRHPNAATFRAAFGRLGVRWP